MYNSASTKPSKVQAWLYAFRLRTLPLAFASILSGSFLGYRFGELGEFQWSVLGLSLLTTLLLQILSNLANDFGDSQKGVDNDTRIGPPRAIQSGILNFKEIKIGIFITGILAFISGLILLFFALRNSSLSTHLFFLFLGVSAIVAALKYTLGKTAYGYQGLGDIFVFLFFGIVGVGGTFYLQTHCWNWSILFPAASFGLFSAGVLNLNNMRDGKSDAASNKNTLVVKIGLQNAKKYHYLLLLFGWIFAIVFQFLNFKSGIQFLFAFTAPLFWRNALAVYNIENPQEFDPLLKQLALSIFIFSIFFALGQYLTN